MRRALQALTVLVVVLGVWSTPVAAQHLVSPRAMVIGDLEVQLWQIGVINQFAVPEPFRARDQVDWKPDRFLLLFHLRNIKGKPLHNLHFGETVVKGHQFHFDPDSTHAKFSMPFKVQDATGELVTDRSRGLYEVHLLPIPQMEGPFDITLRVGPAKTQAFVFEDVPLPALP